MSSMLVRTISPRMVASPMLVSSFPPRRMDVHSLSQRMVHMKQKAVSRSFRGIVIKSKLGDGLSPKELLLRPVIRRIEEETKNLRSLISVRREQQKNLNLNSWDDLREMETSLDREITVVENLTIARTALGLLDPSSQELIGTTQIISLEDEVDFFLKEKMEFINFEAFHEEKSPSFYLMKKWRLLAVRVKELATIMLARINFEDMMAVKTNKLEALMIEKMMHEDIGTLSDLFKLGFILQYEKDSVQLFKEAKVELEDSESHSFLPSLESANKNFEAAEYDLKNLKNAKEELEKLPYISSLEYEFWVELEERARAKFEECEKTLEKVRKLYEAIENKDKRMKAGDDGDI